MPSEKRPYNERLIEQVKALGQVPKDGFPTIEVTRSHASRRYFDILNK